MSSAAIKIKQKYEFLISHINEEKLRQLVEEEKCVPAMVRDLLVRDYPEIYDGEHFSHDVRSSLNTIRGCLKYADFKIDKKHYLSQPNEWRYKYRFPDKTSYEEIKKWCVENSMRGQKITVKKRTKNVTKF